jgi:C-terminal processing protease CtpA/Prc
MIDAIKAHAAKGHYDKITDGDELATRLTKDLQDVSHDKHLRVNFSPFKMPQRTGPTPEDEARFHQQMEHANCAFQKVEILPGNIGYIKFDGFMDAGFCGPTVNAAMAFVAHTDAVIFDLRMNHGGDPAMVALLASYLFDRPTHLDDLYNRHENKTTQYWATPEKVADRLPTQPVYVLTSRFSFSGAEQFCYDLRNLRHATLIGEKTGGAAHPTRNRRINDHFLIAVPEYRYINSVTKTDWEVEGIHPDVPTSPWNALVVAQKLALVRLHRTDVQQSTFPNTASR